MARKQRLSLTKNQRAILSHLEFEDRNNRTRGLLFEHEIASRTFPYRSDPKLTKERNDEMQKKHNTRYSITTAKTLTELIDKKLVIKDNEEVPRYRISTEGQEVYRRAIRPWDVALVEDTWDYLVEWIRQSPSKIVYPVVITVIGAVLAALILPRVQYLASPNSNINPGQMVPAQNVVEVTPTYSTGTVQQNLCGNVFPSRLGKGQGARVCPRAGAVFVWDQPISPRIRVGTLEEGMGVQITGDYVCSENIVFWPVQVSTTLTGFVAETATYGQERYALCWP